MVLRIQRFTINKVDFLLSNTDPQRSVYKKLVFQTVLDSLSLFIYLRIIYFSLILYNLKRKYFYKLQFQSLICRIFITNSHKMTTNLPTIRYLSKCTLL